MEVGEYYIAIEGEYGLIELVALARLAGDMKFKKVYRVFHLRFSWDGLTRIVAWPEGLWNVEF
jgi:hypothetical protein